MSTVRYWVHIISPIVHEACDKSTETVVPPKVSHDTTRELDIDDPIEYEITIPTENIKLKRFAQEATKNRASDVIKFCKNWKQTEEFKNQYLYFDFYHKFLYCSINKVRIRSIIFDQVKCYGYIRHEYCKNVMNVDKTIFGL